MQWHLKIRVCFSLTHLRFGCVSVDGGLGCMSLAINHRCSSNLFLYILFLEQWAIWYMTYLRGDLRLSKGPADMCFLMRAVWTHKVSLFHSPYIVKTNDRAKPLNNYLQSTLFSNWSVGRNIGSLNNDLLYHNSYRNIFLIIFPEIDIFIKINIVKIFLKSTFLTSHLDVCFLRAKNCYQIVLSSGEHHHSDVQQGPWWMYTRESSVV